MADFSMRLLISAGGTGGGVYPALTVQQALQAVNHGTEVEVLWVGSIGGMEEELVKRVGVSYVAVEAGQMHGVGLRAMPGNMLRLGKGYRQARGSCSVFDRTSCFSRAGM